jgi:uncharacterized phage-associated protein
MPTARDVANYFLTLVDPEEGEGLSHLKVQKLVYYAQGFHLAVRGEPLFAERIEAWKYGPVVPELYHALKVHGENAIPPSSDFVPEDVFTSEQLELLDEVYDVYGQYSAWRLRDLTHEEKPWQDAAETAAVISHDSLREYFLTRLNP